MASDWVPREQYDREMAALNARIDTLAAIVSTMQKSGLSNRVDMLEHMSRPLGAVGTPLPDPPGSWDHGLH